MISKSYILKELTPDFICRKNGDIVANKKEIEEVSKSKSQDPCLFKKWHASNLSGYVSDEYRNLRFTS